MKYLQRSAASFLKAGFGLCLAMLIHFSAQGQYRLSKADWKLVPALSDDFNDATPLSAKWEMLENNDTAQTSFSFYNTWNNVFKKDGYAVFQTKKQPCFDSEKRLLYHYSTASLKSKYDEYPGIPSDKPPGGLLYGMYEIRCKLPAKAGQSPCLWLSGQTAWPPEIDVFEYNSRKPTMFFSTIHYRNPAYDGKNAKDVAVGDNHWFPYRLTDDFHTWTMVWTPTSVTWFFDDKQVQLNEVAHQIPGTATWGVNATNRWELYRWEQMKIIFGASLNYPDLEENEFGDFLVDYIHVYKPANLLAFSAAGQKQNAADYYDEQLLPAYQAAIYKTSSTHHQLIAAPLSLELEYGMRSRMLPVCKLPYTIIAAIGP